MSASGGTRAIVAAMFANLGIAISKFVAFLATGSSSLLSESVHSLADTGNQVLLIIGGRRARQVADDAHPFGYGRLRYLYAFIVSIILFTLGGVFALYEGWHKVHHPEPLTSPAWAFGVLGVAVLLESWSLRTAVHESNPLRGSRSWWAFLRHAKAPELPVVLLEDTGALLGLVFALVGVTLAVTTGNGAWDGVGSLAIGVLLVLIAMFLAYEVGSLLVGEGAGAEDVAAIRSALAGGGVHSVIHLRTLYVGPDDLMVAAKVAVQHDDTARGVAAAIDAAEARVRMSVPQATLIYLEPDIRRPPEGGSPPG